MKPTCFICADAGSKEASHQAGQCLPHDLTQPKALQGGAGIAGANQAH